jgi:hypothetical protein
VRKHAEAVCKKGRKVWLKEMHHELSERKSHTTTDSKRQRDTRTRHRHGNLGCSMNLKRL